MRRRPAIAVRGDSILRLPDVLARVGFKRSALYELIKAGQFPRPLPLTAHAVGWRASDVDQWIADRINPTDAARRTG